jgi:hypothetical protein
LQRRVPELGKDKTGDRSQQRQTDSEESQQRHNLQQKLLIFGGAGEEGVYNDVWTLDLGNLKVQTLEMNMEWFCLQSAAASWACSQM